MTRSEQEHFWLYLNLKRVDEEAVRRKIYGLVVNSVLPWAICGLVALAAGIAILAVGSAAWLGTSFTVAGLVVALAGGGVNGWNALSSKASAGLSALVRPANSASRFAAGKLAGFYEEVVQNPDYRAQSGFLYLVYTDIQRVFDLVATPERPLVIFVDDLDRCSPGTVVQVIEAINIFVAGTYQNSIFVIAMEPEMVAAHIEAAYTDLVQKLSETSGRTTTEEPSLGWRFLEKIVQLPLALPAMESNTTTAFFESLFPAHITPVAVPSEALTDKADASAVEEALRTASLSEAVSIAGNVQPDAAIKRGIRRVIERRLTVDDPEVREVIAYASQCLHRNPREIKRFVNLFRFYTMIYAERQIAKLPTPASLHEVAKIAVLCTRWPSLLSTLALPIGNGDERTVFELLENPQSTGDDESGDAALMAALRTVGLSDGMMASIMTAEFQTFMKSAPKVQSGVRGYL